VALFHKHLLGDMLGLLQDSPPVVTLREVGYDTINLFLGLSLDEYQNELIQMESTEDRQVLSWGIAPHIYLPIGGILVMVFYA